MPSNPLLQEGLYRIFNGRTGGALWLPKPKEGSLTEVGDLDEGDERYEWRIKKGSGTGANLYTIRNKKEPTFAVSGGEDGDNVVGKSKAADVLIGQTSSDLLTISPTDTKLVLYWGLNNEKTIYPTDRDSNTDKLNQWQFKRIAD